MINFPPPHFFFLILFNSVMSEKNPPLSPKEEIQLSKLLSYLLRHGAVKEKLNISPEGFIAVDNIVSNVTK